MSDAELLRSYVETRSEAAFTELVQRHLKVVFFAALRQAGGDEHRAKDISQVVFTDLARKAPQLVGHTLLAGWLHRSTRYAALHMMRAERRRERREQEAFAMQIQDSDPAADWERLKPVVDDALLQALSDTDREAVLMRFFHGRPFADIGASLGITADAARFRTDRALARLRTRLAKKGITSTAGALALALASQANAAPPAGLASSVAVTAMSEAATAAAVPAAVGALKFMATAKSTAAVIVVLGATAVGEIWLAWSQARELESLRTSPVSVKITPAASRPVLPAPPPAGATGRVVAPSEPAAIRDGAPPARVAATLGASEPPAAVEAAPPAANFSEAFTLAMDDPEFRALLAVAQGGRLNLFYAPLFKALDLEGERLERFKALLVDKQQAVGDANRSALQLGATQDAAYRVIEGGQGAINTEIRALLGDDGWARYQRYEATRGQRIVVEQLQRALSYTATPLRDDQAAALVDALYQSSPRPNPPTTNGLGAQVAAGLRERDLSAPITEQGMVAAQGMLAAPQVDALRQLQQWQKERQRLAQKLKPVR